MGRLKNAWAAILGRDPWAGELARMRVEWQALMLSIADYMEVLDRKVGRANVAKRRDRNKTEDAAVVEAAKPTVLSRWAKKAALRHARLGHIERTEPMPVVPTDDLEEAK